MRKSRGKETMLCYGDRFLMVNRNGLWVGFGVTQATVKAEEETAEAVLK